MPHGHDRHLFGLEIVEQTRLLAKVAYDDHRVAMARLENGGKRHRLVGPPWASPSTSE